MSTRPAGVGHSAVPADGGGGDVTGGGGAAVTGGGDGVVVDVEPVGGEGAVVEVEVPGDVAESGGGTPEAGGEAEPTVPAVTGTLSSGPDPPQAWIASTQNNATPDRTISSHPA